VDTMSDFLGRGSLWTPHRVPCPQPLSSPGAATRCPQLPWSLQGEQNFRPWVSSSQRTPE
ncbi:Hypothetical predicted protein, partial [Marmota monax]